MHFVVFFLTLGNDCDGDFELTFSFHSENPAKDERLTALGDRQTVFDIFEAFQKAFVTDVTDLRRESKRKKGDVCILSVCFSTLENNYDGDFELTFNFHTEDLTKNERLTAYRRDRFTQGKEGRKGDVCILSFSS